jgi:predicted ABC-type ATPase
MVAGPNGAGKTTLTGWLRRQAVEFGEYINADEIAESLAGSYGARVADAQVIADRRRQACIEARRSFTFETVMSHPSKVDVLVRAREAGYFVQLFFVGTEDPQTNVERVALRVAQGGHDVPVDRIVARWQRTMNLLHQAIAASDRSLIFDNSATMPTLDGPRLALEIGNSLETKRTIVRRFAATPAWVRYYVLDRVEPDAKR